jgi:hypothetical protein
VRLLDATACVLFQIAGVAISVLAYMNNDLAGSALGIALVALGRTFKSAPPRGGGVKR